MPGPDGWLSTPELLEGLAACGFATTDRQLERWRAEGLLPAAHQAGNYRGSTTWHPPSVLRQAIAIERALAVKHRFDHVGAVLWAAGFDVDERYWRPALVRQEAQLQLVVRRIRRFTRRDADRPTLGDKVAVLDRMTGVVGKVARRLDTHQLARFANVTAEVASGEFEAFDEARSDRDEFTSAEAMARGLDFHPGEADEIWGKRLNLAGAFEGVLADISAVYGGSDAAELSDTEIIAARDDVRNALKMGFCLHEGLAWIYGPQAFGLRLAAFLARTASSQAIVLFSTGFARLRRRSNQFYSSIEIAQMAERAEAAWLISNYFRQLHLQRPDLGKLISSKRFKLAFSDSAEQRNLLRDLRAYELPTPVFRPWDQWNKYSKATTSPGLLAMSIGAPLDRGLDDITRSANGTANP